MNHHIYMGIVPMLAIILSVALVSGLYVMAITREWVDYPEDEE